MTGTPTFKRLDSTIDFTWNTNPPASGFPRTNFSVRWDGWLVAPMTDTYTVTVNVDDGVRIWLGNNEIVNKWGSYPGTYTANVQLTADQMTPITVEYQQVCCSAYIHLFWSANSQPYEIIPASTLYPQQ
jgi:hypothetical protein